VTVQASPAGASFTVDGTSYSGSQMFTWTAGSMHTIAATSPQSAGTGAQYAWISWSDGGGISHAISPISAGTFTASFATQYLLNTGVSPIGGGGVTPSPSSPTGYYNSGAQVQLTAAANPICTFMNWSGGLSGGANPQTVTMSAPVTVTANFQCSGPAATDFLTGYALNAPVLRDDFTGWVGMKITVGASPLSVSSVGRVCVAGNSGSHTVKFVSAGTGTDVPGASVLLNLSGCTPGQFLYGALASPVTLQANTAYFLASQEASGGDQWYDYGTVSSTIAATVNSSIYSVAGTSWIPAGQASTSYVPVDFQYSLAPADPTFVTGYNLNNRPLRNNFSGWVGMEFTVGASGMVVNSLGRLFVAGNSGLHTVKLVNASNGTDVAGASVAVSLAGGTAGQFSYMALASPVVLPANTSYYLVSQESAAGDQWYDYGTVTSAVYSYDSVDWILIGAANSSYIPPNLK
jgi:List-Bact-rpt repeat protein